MVKNLRPNLACLKVFQLIMNRSRTNFQTAGSSRLDGMAAGETTGELKGGAESVSIGALARCRSFQDLGDGRFLGAAGQAQEDVFQAGLPGFAERTQLIH